MANKKIMMSVTATAAIAAACLGAEEAEAASYKVKSGDSLWKIAQQHNTSVSLLKKFNNLSGDIIFPNQVLETSKKNSSSTTSNSNSNNNSSSSNTSTYTVKSGDSLSAIAFKHNISISNLMKWNNLNSTLIYPGNKFVVSKSGSSSSNSNSGSSSSSSSNSGSSSSNSGSTGSSEVYTVKSGDSLSRIGASHGVSVANLKKWNNLSSDFLSIGQKLNIGGKSSSDGSSSNSSSSSNNSGSSNSSSSNTSSSNSSAGYNVDTLISSAKSVNGTPYVWGGSTTSGFDCSGFIHYTFKKAGKDMGRLSSDGYYNRSQHVNNPQVGDLVFFAGTYRAGISHLGIYLGNNQFIHAGSDGVEISNLNNPYWKKHFDSFKRFY